jgi:hypothetical protein
MNENRSYALTQSVNKFHYGIYTYTKCKSETIYLHNTNHNAQLSQLLVVASSFQIENS